MPLPIQSSNCEHFFNIGSDNDAINGRNIEVASLQTQNSSVPPSDFYDLEHVQPDSLLYNELSLK